MSIPFAKVGLWGGHGGNPVDIDAIDEPPKRLISVTIRSGAIIDAISFTYVDTHGNQHSTGLWGGGGGNPSQILLDPLEYVKEVSGTYFQPFDPSTTLVTSLNIVTTSTTYSFGGGGGSGKTFSIPVRNGGQIVGFFGRSGSFLDAIGVYIRITPTAGPEE